MSDYTACKDCKYHLRIINDDYDEEVAEAEKCNPDYCPAPVPWWDECKAVPRGWVFDPIDGEITTADFKPCEEVNLGQCPHFQAE